MLEEAKLARMPTPKSLANRVALVASGAGGTGAPTADRLLREGACVMRADIDADALADAHEGLAASPNATAYGTAMAAKIHLAPCLAL